MSKKTITTYALAPYLAPECDAIEQRAESVLCASLPTEGGLDKFSEEEFIW